MEAGVVSVLRGLDERALSEPTPIFDELMADVGSLLRENPWRFELARPMVAWKMEPDWRVPNDYMTLKLPMGAMLDLVKRTALSRFDTRAMQVIGVGEDG